MAMVSTSGGTTPELSRTRGLLPHWARAVRTSVLALPPALHRWRRRGAPDPLADLVRTAERLHYGGGGR
jgi:hypothetical protein